jgi:hypothetical protein
MELAEVYVALGQERTVRLARTIAIGALKTYGVYEGIKIRSRLHKFNRQKLRAAAPKLWRRIATGDGDLARELSQAVLVSNIPLIVEVLDLLKIEHDDNGFFAKDFDYSDHLSSDWAETVSEEFIGRYPEELVLLYINHLGWETGTLDEPFLGSILEASAARAE